MVEIAFRLQPTAGHQRVSNADRCGTSESHSDVELIILLQKTIVNDAENVTLVLRPILIRKLGRNFFKLVGKTIFTGNLISITKHSRNCFLMLRAVLPEIKLAGVFTPAGIGNIKHISKPGKVPAVINERDPLGAAPHISPHGVVPKVIFRTGRCIGPLGENHHLLRERIFIEPRRRSQKGRPPLVAACQPGCDTLGHLCIALQFTRHPCPPRLQNPGTAPARQTLHRPCGRAFPAWNR